jgi:2-polyprenyl-6-methoxyphenol hydroxylase-like FAD-dependent oxidoreductase
LERAGGKVERGTELITCRNQPDGTVEAVLQHPHHGRSETVTCPWLLAADGAHSTTRESTGVTFRGSSLQHRWHLIDGSLHTRLDASLAHAFFYDHGFLFLIRVIDDAASRSATPPIWRVISNHRALLSRIPESEVAGPPVWTSEFHVSHRITAQFQAGNIYFAGDAAHIHSPIGARGMNLGIEDAWVFSELVRTRQLHRYEALRKDVDGLIVKRIERLSRIISSESVIARLIRSVAPPLVAKLPALQHRLLPVLTGLDHDLPLFIS